MQRATGAVIHRHLLKYGGGNQVYVTLVMAQQPDQGYKINAGSAFHADAVTVMHTPRKIMLDFKLTTARVDQVGGNHRQTVVVEHDAVEMEPELAKELINLLQDNLEKYEEKHGEVEERSRPDQETDGEDVEVESSSYIG